MWTFSWSGIEKWLSEIQGLSRQYLFEHLVKSKILYCKLGLQKKINNPCLSRTYRVVIIKDNLKIFQIRVSLHISILSPTVDTIHHFNLGQSGMAL